ncbi:MAG: hypothetical protein P4L50_20150 [Anaerolineaceae bacterium]|nr:hypothetical protein [Anaerolineaceae bacterium]
MDEAYAISGCSNATATEKLLANSYITGMIFAQSAFAFGAVDSVGEAFLAALGTLGPGLTACAATGNCEEEINTAKDTLENIETEFTETVFRNSTGTAYSLTPRPGVDDIPGSG